MQVWWLNINYFLGWIEVRDVMINRITPWYVPLIYIHIFCVLGWLIGLTLFIGVVVANYNENKGTALLTVDQRRWEDLSRRLKIVQPLHQPPRPDGDGIRAAAYDLSQHTRFKRLIAFCVLANSFLLSLKWKEDTDEAMILASGSCFFSFIFIIEVLIKLIGMGMRGMCQSFRNTADLLITIASIPWLFLYFLQFQQKDWTGFSYKYGVILILCRFLFICGKHVSIYLFRIFRDLIRIYQIVNVIEYSKKSDNDNCRVCIQIVFHYSGHVSVASLLCVLGRCSIWKC